MYIITFILRNIGGGFATKFRFANFCRSVAEKDIVSPLIPGKYVKSYSIFICK